MANKTFVGFSTDDLIPRRGRTWALYDVDLIERDLLNHFHTRKGERVMRPAYGCAIWDLLMEPLTATLASQVEQEVRRICEEDTRVLINSIQLSYGDQSITVNSDLTYLPSRTVRQFTITFDNQQTY